MEMYMSVVRHTLDGVRFRTITNGKAKGKWSSRTSMTYDAVFGFNPSIYTQGLLPDDFDTLMQHDKLRILAAACRKVGLRMQPMYRRTA